jgi:hypothetical protein
LLPCSRVKKKSTGPDVNGRPKSKPPTEGPHLRATMLTIQMRIGTLTNFIGRIAQVLSIMASRRKADLDRVTVKFSLL